MTTPNTFPTTTTLTLDETWGPDGLAFARVDGFPVKFPGALPGETIEATIDRTTRPWRGQLVEVITPSEDRRQTQVCPHLHEAPLCGGCPWGMVSEEKQAALKHQLTLDALMSVGITPPEKSEHYASTTTTGYRSKALFTMVKRDGGWAWGLYANGSHDVVKTPVCQAIAGWMNAAVASVAHALNATTLTPYDEVTHTGDVRGVLLREGVNAAGQTERLVSLILREVTDVTLATLKAALLPALASQDIKVVSVQTHSERGNAALGGQEYFLTEEHTITTTIGDLSFSVGSTTFLQIHREQMLSLYHTAIKWADLQATDTLVDLYCGIGTMTLVGAKRVAKSIGVDVVEASIAAARENATHNNIHNAEFHAGAVEKVLPSLIVNGLRADKVIVDPAFKGMDATVPAMIKALDPKTLVYVSCNPKTFARDVKVLLSLGFTLERVATFDLFPDTAHVETVARLVRT